MKKLIHSETTGHDKDSKTRTVKHIYDDGTSLLKSRTLAQSCDSEGRWKTTNASAYKPYKGAYPLLAPIKVPTKEELNKYRPFRVHALPGVQA